MDPKQKVKQTPEGVRIQQSNQVLHIRSKPPQSQPGSQRSFETPYHWQRRWGEMSPEAVAAETAEAGVEEAAVPWSWWKGCPGWKRVLRIWWWGSTRRSHRPRLLGAPGHSGASGMPASEVRGVEGSSAFICRFLSVVPTSGAVDDCCWVMGTPSMSFRAARRSYSKATREKRNGVED